MIRISALILMSLLSLLFPLSGSAQHMEKSVHESHNEMFDLVRAERRTAESVMQFKVNQKTGNYDIVYHRLECTVDPAVKYISGVVTSYFVPTKENFNQVNFDFEENMTVDTVLYHGSSLSFTLADGNLEIDLPAPLAIGTIDSIAIKYHGVPLETGFIAFETDTHNDIPVMWTLSEPYGAKTWWPCKQDLIDKIDSVDIIVTTPEQYRVASNGLLVNEFESGSGFKTFHWKHRYPIPAYLVFFAVTNYASFTDYVNLENGSSIPILNYVYPEDLASAEEKLAGTIEQMELFNDLFGLYPFADEKYGHAQMGWGGGMEHQTMSSMGGFSYSLQAHELAHQWFGDKVTCGTWEDIWLNEGFATYLEALTREHYDGKDAFISWRENTVSNITSKNDGSVFCSDTTSVGRIFSWRLSYQKGAMVLHMLRYKLGDADFFDALRNYLSDPELAYGYARTSDLQNHLEAQSGMDIEEFLADWFMGEGHPSYELYWNQSGDEAYFLIKQSQSHPSVSFFEMPVPVKVLGSDGQSQWFWLENTENGQLFVENVTFPISGVQLDPEFELISAANMVIRTPCLPGNEIPAIVIVDTLELPEFITLSSCKDGIIYLVPEGTDQDIAVIREAAIDSLIAPALSPVHMALSGLENGVYWLYTKDSSGNISAPEAFSIMGVGVEPYGAGNVMIYPNPTNTLLNIRLFDYSGQYNIEITSLNGQLIYSTVMEGNTHQIDFTPFPKGAYFITIRSRDYLITRKIIKL